MWKLIISEYYYWKYRFLNIIALIAVTNLLDYTGALHTIGFEGDNSVMYMVAIMSFPMNWVLMFNKDKRAEALMNLPVTPLKVALLRTIAPLLGMVILFSIDLLIKTAIGIEITKEYAFSLLFGFVFYMLICSVMQLMRDLPNIKLNLKKDELLTRQVAYVAVMTLISIIILVGFGFAAKFLHSKTVLAIATVAWGLLLQSFSVFVFMKRKRFV